MRVMVGELSIPGAIAAATVADAAAGDADALARIVGAHHNDMARICYVICGDQEMAQDAVQAACSSGSSRPFMTSLTFTIAAAKLRMGAPARARIAGDLCPS